ncbi:hypothetical protein [Hymenobacter sp.]|uniref:hypothetical protein n=1 Tax=Hymenobacter sp. TaxID=1898978 RepID=UPI002EDA08A2
MKNEWDMLAYVRQQLAVGATLVEFRYVTPGLTGPGGRPGRVANDKGTEYEIGPDFLTGVIPAVRENYISYSIDNWSGVLGFGTELRPTPTSYFINGEEVPVINLTPNGPVQLISLDLRPADPPPPKPDEEE